jgi:hypothetical protein
MLITRLLNICNVSCLNKDEMKVYSIKYLLQLQNILLLNPSVCVKQTMSTIEQSEIPYLYSRSNTVMVMRMADNAERNGKILL